MPEILIADDHPLFRDALSRAAAQAIPTANLLQADSVPALLALVDAHPDADLLLLDPIHEVDETGWPHAAPPQAQPHG